MAKDKPYYPHAPIASLDSLAKTLGVAPKLLTDLSRDAHESYTHFRIYPKGKLRDVYEPKYELKRLQKRINSRIFEKVQFPPYLQGGIRDKEAPRDHVENGRIHAGSKFLISLDVKDFYGSIKESYVYSVFKNFFRFPDDVSRILTKLVTLNCVVPQGACTSSYVANLIFHNAEYSLVSKIKSQGLQYTRLLDDITISSPILIDQKKATDIVGRVVGMLHKYELVLKHEKTKLERSDDLNASYSVTGVWVGHGVPKLRRDDKRYIRQLVYICEKEYQKDCFSDEYHALWNRVSGQVSKLGRLNHSQAKSLRGRMGKILPLYNDQMKAKIIFEAKKLLRKPRASHARIGVVNAYHRVIYSLGVLSRTDRLRSRSLKRQLRERFSNIPLKADIWE